MFLEDLGIGSLNSTNCLDRNNLRMIGCVTTFYLLRSRVETSQKIKLLSVNENKIPGTKGIMRILPWKRIYEFKTTQR